MLEGTIQRYDEHKGYGYISYQTETTDHELFFHRRAVELSDFNTVCPGQSVAFEIARGEKGWQAVNLQRVMK
ncbi:MAG: cold shock domain-containing protein [Aerococcus sp.]|nr:cold shock domain-containing protein [Aerococcus sp.]